MGIIAELSFLSLSVAVMAGAIAGFVKGAVGFGMPLVMISALANFWPAEVALAALILPTVLSNGYQMLRQGLRAAWRTVLLFRGFLAAMLMVLWLSAQSVAVLPQSWLFLLIGFPVVLFSIAQLWGWVPSLSRSQRNRAELLGGAIAGLSGGVSGVWGPPTVAYLTAIQTPKNQQMRIQGVIYGVGAVALLLAHLRSGVLNLQTLPLSAALVVPAMVGMMIGGALHDRLPQAAFRRVTLAVLIIAGLNLIRKGVLG